MTIKSWFLKTLKLDLFDCKQTQEKKGTIEKLQEFVALFFVIEAIDVFHIIKLSESILMLCFERFIFITLF